MSFSFFVLQDFLVTAWVKTNPSSASYLKGIFSCPGAFIRELLPLRVGKFHTQEIKSKSLPNKQGHNKRQESYKYKYRYTCTGKNLNYNKRWQDHYTIYKINIKT